MFSNRLQSADFLSSLHRVINKVIIQAVRSGCFAVCRRCGQMLRNPPRLIAKLTFEAAEPLAVSTASVGHYGKHVFTEPCQQLRTNFRTNVLSRWILGSGLKFLLEFCVPGRIEFEHAP